MVALMSGQVCEALRLGSIGAAYDDKPLTIMRHESGTQSLQKIGPDCLMKAQVNGFEEDDTMPYDFSQT